MSKTIRVADITQDSIVDGEGLRLTVFAQGCSRGCDGCHNPQTHDRSGGREMTVLELLALVVDNPLLDGVTFSGGEPFEQAEALAVFAQRVHALGLNVWVYTGYTREELQAAGRDDWQALLDETDVLVDGPYIEAERELNLKFRGSRNQRVINMKTAGQD